MTTNLAVRDFLKTDGTLADLQERYAIKSVPHPEFPGLYLLKYNIIDSPMGEQIVQECRGIILDEDRDWEPVAWPFHKFFNHNEELASSISWETAWVQEKADGSMCVMYWYRDHWNVSTSGSPDASGAVNGGQELTFADLFWRVYQSMGYPLPGVEHRDLTLMFELTTPYNRVVIPHHEERLTLIGIRDRRTGQEYPAWILSTLDDLGLHHYSQVGSYDLSSFEGIQKSFETLSPLQTEGYVVADLEFHRVKVKHPGYVAIHHMKDGLSARRLMEVIRSGESAEFRASFLDHFPEFSPDFLDLERRYATLVKEIEAAYETIKGLETQKSFALEAAKTRMPSALFDLRSGRAGSVRAHLAKIHVDNLLEALSHV